MLTVAQKTYLIHLMPGPLLAVGVAHVPLVQLVGSEVTPCHVARPAGSTALHLLIGPKLTWARPKLTWASDTYDPNLTWTPGLRRWLPGADGRLSNTA